MIFSLNIVVSFVVRSFVSCKVSIPVSAEFPRES